MVCLPASYVFSGRFDIESGPPSIPQGQNLSLYFDLVAFLSQLFKIPFVQAIFLNYAEFVPLNTTVEPSLKATSDHNNHLCTKATFLSWQTVHTLNLVQTSLQRQRPLQRVPSCQNNLFNNGQFLSATDEKVKNSHDIWFVKHFILIAVSAVS